MAEALDAYRFDGAALGAYHFVWGTFCDWYLELVKPALQGENGAAKAEAQATAAWVLRSILHILHPFMPFVTEELWGQFGDGSGFLMNRSWPKPAASGDDTVLAEVDWVVRLISAIREVRAQLNVPPSAQLEMKVAGEFPADRFAHYGDIIARLARIAKVTPIPAGEAIGAHAAQSAQFVVDAATYILPLAGVIDIAKEKARLEKEIERLVIEIAKVDKKLSNADFMAKARPEVVEENQERRAEWQAACDRLTEAFNRLGDA